MDILESSERRAETIGPRRPRRDRFRSPPTRLRYFDRGSHLYRDGDEALHVYEVRTGVLRLTRVRENGARQVLCFAYPGDFVGFPHGGRNRGDCEVIAPAQLAVYPVSALSPSGNDPETHRKLVQAALREIANVQDHLSMLARKSAAEKLAGFLRLLDRRIGADRDGGRMMHLSMRRADIADFLGLTTETVSRTFTQMRRRGLIAIDDPQEVRILDPLALAAVAEGD